MLTLKGKNIVVTGASSGIGRQIAITCSQLGAKLILIARDTSRLQETIESLDGTNHLSYSIDLEQYDSIEPVIADAVQKNGKLNGFVYAAGIEMTIPLNFQKTKNFDKLFSVNTISGFEMARIVSLKKYLNSEGLSFIFIASVMSFLGQPGKVAYCSSKGALIAGAKAMALELAPKKIRVNAISPGIVETEMSLKLFSELPVEAKENIIKMHPLGIGKTIDVANLVVFLLSDLSSWITGTNIVIDGGYSAQ
jgi:NAD(P)-dependent dehydrogenase (short-subunit alcohol dehydrogenase family)